MSNKPLVKYRQNQTNQTESVCFFQVNWKTWVTWFWNHLDFPPTTLNSIRIQTRADTQSTLFKTLNRTSDLCASAAWTLPLLRYYDRLCECYL